jgi:hypothetical protein
MGFTPGPRVELPWRTYVLFAGPLAAVPAMVEAHDGYTPNLWWPDDHAWCIATEIDLPWTYVGGSAALIAEVLADPRLEAQPVSPGDNHHERLPEWLEPVVNEAVSELLDAGAATIRTWRGTVRAELDRPDGERDGDLRIQRITGPRSRGSSWSRVMDRDPEQLRAHAKGGLARAVQELI